MLDVARRAAQEAGVTDTVAQQRGDAGGIAEFFEAHSFDVILCHNVLEFVEDRV